jgi:hypothetical protein
MLLRILILTLAAILTAQVPDPHEGQPAVCNNHHGKEHPCACQRATKCADDQSEEEDSKCQTFCREDRVQVYRSVSDIAAHCQV